MAALHGKGPQTEVDYRLAWARTYLKNYGLLVNSDRGIWALSPVGLKTKQIDPLDVVQTVRLGAKRKRVPETVVPGGEEEPQDAPTLEEGPWQAKLLNVILSMSPEAFERLCQRLLRESGFIQVDVTGRSGDGGIDGRGVIRVAGLISFNVLFQSKRHRGSIGAGTVRDFRGAMIGRADKGLLISTGTFTSDAQREATRDGAPPIDLIDGELLALKLKELHLGVRTQMVEAVEVDPAWFKSI